jgi:hypothetical protein
MKLVHAASRTVNHARLRVGFTLGLGLALVILAVGTATGTVTTQFQKVIVTNTAESPIPVTGTISVANLPDSQDVEVTNFPDTQTVSGTVDVGNFPAGPLATIRHTASVTPSGFTGSSAFIPFALMNVTDVIVADGDEDNYDVGIGGFPLVVDHEGNFSEHFTAAFPATGVNITCENAVVDCDVTVTVLGY